MFKTIHLKIASIAFFLCAMEIIGCGDSGGSKKSKPPRKGDRILGVDINMSQSEESTGNFDSAANRAIAVGAEMNIMMLHWDDTETAPGVYNPPVNLLAIANAYYPAKNIKIGLVIDPIDTNNLTVPADLSSSAFNSPSMINRFNALADWAFTQIPNLELTYFAVGNEIDAYLGTDSAKWTQYEQFFNAVKTHIKLTHPSLLVSSTTTFGGAAGPSTQSYLVNFANSTDIVLMTYYAINPDFTVKAAVGVSDDFDDIASIYAGKTVLLHECGCPSSATCLSSEDIQAQFIRTVFSSWDKHRSQIKMVDFVWLTDVSQAQVDQWAIYYGISDVKFKEYLRTIGLRTYPDWGTDKKAYTTLKAEAAARGW